MKKTVCIMLGVVLALFLVFPAMALSGEASLSLAPSVTTLGRNEELQLTVKLHNCDICKSLALVFDYDTESTFEIVDGKWLLSDTLIDNFDKTTTKAGTAAAAFTDATDINGDIFLLTLKVKDDAPAGEKTVKVTPSVKNGTKEIACASSEVKVALSDGSGGESTGGSRLTMKVSDEMPKAGKEFTVTVGVKDCALCKSLAFVFDYDTESTFEIVDGKWLLSDTLIDNFDKTTTKAGTAAAAFSDATDINGDAFELKLKVKDGAPTGNAKISVLPSMKNGAATVACEGTSVTVNIPSGKVPGDMNGNGKFDADDVIYLLKALFDPVDYPIAEGVSNDVDASGKFDADDVIYLLKALFNPVAYPIH